MSERRKWDKQSDFHPSMLSGNSTNGMSDVASGSTTVSDPVLEKQRQYIKMLEERNRLKKKLVAASKSQKERDHLQEREEAFVTTFNVPKATVSSTHHHHSSSSTVRKNKSAAALLPTRMAPPSCASSSSATSLSVKHQALDSERQSSCRSAPSTTLPFQRGSDDGQAQQRPGAARAKWSKPQGPMNIAVENRDGRAHYCLADPSSDPLDAPVSDAKQTDEHSTLQDTSRKSSGSDSSGEGDGDEDDDSEDVDERYLEESFEEFDEEEETVADAKDAPLDDAASSKQASPLQHDVKARDVDASANTLTPTPDLSRTTTELFHIIQHLSRSKQKALTTVLQKFQASAQRDSDVQELQSSIGDPAIWQQLTASLFSSNSHDTRPAPDAKPTPLAQVLQEQQQWEEAYAQQVKERLAKERAEKEQALRDAEARRKAMMQQLEDEERELEQLMEAKRQERLAKLKALEQEIDSVPVALGVSATTPDASASASADNSSPRDAKPLNASASRAKRSPKKRSDRARQSRAAVLDAEPIARGSESKTLTRESTEDEQERTDKPAPVVPPLRLGAVNTTALADVDASSASLPSSVEVRIKLLSTWGKTRAVGLTQISVYSKDGAELAVDMASLKVFDESESHPLPNTHDMVRGLGRLFNGIAHTNSEHDMWLGRLSSSGEADRWGQCVACYSRGLTPSCASLGTLQVSFHVPTAPSKLCVWNYNSVRTLARSDERSSPAIAMRLTWLWVCCSLAMDSAATLSGVCARHRSARGGQVRLDRVATRGVWRRRRQRLYVDQRADEYEEDGSDGAAGRQSNDDSVV